MIHQHLERVSAFCSSLQWPSMLPWCVAVLHTCLCSSNFESKWGGYCTTGVEGYTQLQWAWSSRDASVSISCPSRMLANNEVRSVGEEGKVRASMASYSFCCSCIFSSPPCSAEHRSRCGHLYWVVVWWDLAGTAGQRSEAERVKLHCLLVRKLPFQIDHRELKIIPSNFSSSTALVIVK